MTEATALPTEPPPLPSSVVLWKWNVAIDAVEFPNESICSWTGNVFETFFVAFTTSCSYSHVFSFSYQSLFSSSSFIYSFFFSLPFLPSYHSISAVTDSFSLSSSFHLILSFIFPKLELLFSFHLIIIFISTFFLQHFLSHLFLSWGVRPVWPKNPLRTERHHNHHHSRRRRRRCRRLHRRGTQVRVERLRLRHLRSTISVFSSLTNLL